MIPWFHNTAMNMGVDQPKGRSKASCRLFRARAGGDAVPGFVRGSTLGGIPAAASRLKGFAILTDTNGKPTTFQTGFSEDSVSRRAGDAGNRIEVALATAAIFSRSQRVRRRRVS